MKYFAVWRRLILLLLVIGVQPFAYAKTLNVSWAESPKEAYPLGLLKLALSYSDTQYTYKKTSELLTQGKQVNEVKSGGMDVAWLGTSQQLEQELLPIRIPVYRGLLGHRIFIIRAGDQARFDNITTLAQLKQVPLGQGRFWADAGILKAAGFNVVTATKYDGLFYMLDGGRFDAFPRGVHEPWSELKQFNNLPLTTEQKLMVIYPMPMYFFVNKNNKALAAEIRNGLEKAIADGSFEQYFFNNPMIQDVLQKAHLKQRRAFRINNPDLSPETPLDRQELWFDYKNY